MMYKFLWLWMIWLIFLLLSTSAQAGTAIHSGMPLIYDAIDTSLWELDTEAKQVSLLLDFDAPMGTISPISFRVDRQSVIYLRVPVSGERGISPFELFERNFQTGVEFSIMKAQWIFGYEMPTNDAVLLQIVEGGESYYCVLFFQSMVCSPAAQELVDFVRSETTIWQSEAGYALTERALYRFHLETLSWELLLRDEWILARTAAYHAGTNSLYVFGNLQANEGGCRSSQIMRIDLTSLERVLVPIELPNCVSNFARMQISPDGHYLQYNTREVVLIELETGRLVYRPNWYSGRAVWLEDSRGLLFMAYEQPGESANRVSLFNIETRELSLVYQGYAGYVRLYQVP